MIIRNQFADMDEEYDKFGVACGCSPSHGLSCHFVFAKNVVPSKQIDYVEPMKMTYQKECKCASVIPV